MHKFLNNFFAALFFTFSVSSIAQEGVKNPTPVMTKGKISGKIMLVPFEPKLYMSTIDQNINKTSHWNFNQIRENFRRQLDAQLKLTLQTYGTVVSFYTDSAKMAKDLNYIYNSTSLSYDLIEKPSNPIVSTTSKNTNIKNGQLAVEIGQDKKFMNTKIINTEVLSYLNKKYTSDHFVFINELDINTNPDSYNINTDTYLRDVTVHYSILDKTGKLINAGAAVSTFSSKINEPKKIVAQAFFPIATYIATKYNTLIKSTPSK